MTSWSGRRVTANRAAVLAAYGDTCHLCGLPGADTADHLIPRSRGGDPFDIEQQRPAHRSCNSRRGAKPLAAVPFVNAWEFFEKRDAGQPRVPCLFSPENEPKTAGRSQT